MTKVCIPTAGPGGLDDYIGEHFGRVPTYTIYDAETGQVEVVDNMSEHMGGSGLPAEILSGLRINVLLCSGLGRRSEKIARVECLIGYEGNAFAFTGDVRNDLLDITSVHPMREDAVKYFLKCADADWSVFQRLIDEEQLEESEHLGKKFYTRYAAER